MRSASIMLALLTLLAAVSAPAQTPECDRLTGEQRSLALDLLSTLHPYDCCDGTIAECVKQEPVCALAWRLAQNLCRRVGANEDRDTITRSLHRRARSMVPSNSPAAIDLSGVPTVGSVDARVTVVEYACARCPFCAKLTPLLYTTVTEGPLQGKVKLYFKVFPIRSHEYSKDAGLAFLAAAELGKFWEFMLYSYERFDAFCIDKQSDWAEAVGMDRAAFAEQAQSSAVRDRLVASKKEGIRNKVEATPTFFISGRKYVGDMTRDELIDVIEEEYDRLTGVRYRNAETRER
jgi:protein-disulfide isomerase